MKKMILSTCALVFLTVAAHASGLDLYEAMNVPEVDARPVNDEGIPSVGAAIVSKTISGLKCVKTTVVYPGAKPTVSCTFTSPADAETIYNSLLLQEMDGRPTDGHGHPVDGVGILVKSADGFNCKKIQVVYPGAKPKYSCSVQF